MSESNQPVSGQLYMSQRMNIVSFDHTHRLVVPVGRLMRHIRFLFGEQPASLSELIVQVEEASAPAQLAKTLNHLQDRLWQLSPQEQSRFREIIVNALTSQVLHTAYEPVRREAANWLRLFVQSGQVANPTEVFVTLVTAAVQISHSSQQCEGAEQNPYLKMIFDCFWPFRHPYQAYTWEVFPPNSVFYPLAAMFQQAGEETIDLLFGIFAELPSLDDPAISDHLLPVALHWSQSENAERRRRVVPVLARMRYAAAQQRLAALLQDADLQVRIAARDAATFGEAASS